MKIPKIYLSEIQKKGLILALALSLLLNIAMFMSMPKAQSMVVPFSAVGDYSVQPTYVTVEPSTEFPLWHVLYSIGFAIVILVIMMFAAIHLSATKNLTGFWSVGAIIAILFCGYMTFYSPYSQFAIGTATINIRAVDDSGNPIQNVQCYLYANNVYQGLKTGASGTVTFSNIPIAGYYSGKCLCPTDSSKKSPEYKDIIVGYTINVNTYINNCVRCTQGVQKCTSNVVYTCTSSQNWQATKTCSSIEQCSCSGSSCSCSAASCGADGMKCIDSTTLQECKNGAWTNNRFVCLNGCSNNKCNTACEVRWKCKDSVTAGQQRADCTWIQLINCAPGTCIDDGEQGYCSTPDTTVITTTRTTTTRTTTPPTPTTTVPNCNYNGVCEAGETAMCADCIIPPPTTTTTTVGVCAPYSQECKEGFINLCSSDGMSWIRSNTACSGTTTTTPIITTTTIQQCTLGLSCTTYDGKAGTCKQTGIYAAMYTCIPQEPTIDYLLYGGIGLVVLLVFGVGFVMYKRR